MDKKLKRSLRHKAAFYAIFVKGNIIVVMLMAVCLSAAYQLFTFDNLHMQMKLIPLVVSFVVSFVFVYILAMYTDSDIESVAVSWQCRNNEEILELMVKVKYLEEKLNSNPAPAGFLDEREADLYDYKKKIVRLESENKELEKVSTSFT